jgi:hypothetical protein
MTKKIKDIVVNNLKSAKENGQWEPGGYLNGVSAEVIAEDMVAYAEDCENLDPKDIVEYVRVWLAKEIK